MQYKESWLTKAERKFRKFSIPNLMLYVVIGMGMVFLFEMILPPGRFSLSSLLMFDRNAIFHGQIWRLFTFILIPPNASVFFILFSLYFYWLIGSALESAWGSFRFTLYYLCGMLGSMLAGLITGYATNSYLNLSLLIGFALVYPNNEVLLFFIIPLKMKYLAVIEGVGLLFMFIRDSWAGRLALVMALCNIILFFGKDFIDNIKAAKRRKKFQKDMQNTWRR